MKKFWLLTISLLLMFGQSLNCAMASSHKPSGPVSIAIRKYKAGNYTGCLQDTQMIVKRDPSNVIAYYYMAMAYSQAGRKDKAIEAYQKVLSLKPNAVLYRYASTGKRCLETPDKCKPTDKSSEIDKMVTSPYGDGMSAKVRGDIEQKRLDAVRQEINSGKDVNNYQFRQFPDYTHRTEADVEDSVAVQPEMELPADTPIEAKASAPVRTQAKVDSQVSKQPTNDEIVAAIKILKQAGLDPTSVYSQGANPLAQVANTQNSEIAQMSMLMGGNQSNGGNNNAALNMIPYMLSQSKNGAGNAYTPQLMQSMIMNSMLPDFNYNTDKDK